MMKKEYIKEEYHDILKNLILTYLKNYLSKLSKKLLIWPGAII